MTNEQKMRLLEMRRAGLSITEISNRLGISVNTIKSFIRRGDDAGCRHCGASLEQMPKHKLRHFCSPMCRIAYWNTHRELHETAALSVVKCVYSGATFRCYGNKARKYCSHECFIAHRFPRKAVGV